MRAPQPVCSILSSSPCQTLGWLPPNFFAAWTNFLQSSGWREASLTPKVLPYGPPSAKCAHPLCSILVTRWWSVSLQERGDHFSVLSSPPFFLWTPVSDSSLSSLGLSSPDLVPKIEFSDQEGLRSVETLQREPEASAGGRLSQKVWSLPRHSWGQIWV